MGLEQGVDTAYSAIESAYDGGNGDIYEAMNLVRQAEIKCGLDSLPSEIAKLRAKIYRTEIRVTAEEVQRLTKERRDGKPNVILTLVQLTSRLGVLKDEAKERRLAFRDGYQTILEEALASYVR